MKNRVLSVLLTLCMVLALFPGTAFAAELPTGVGTTTDGSVYAINNDVTLATLVSAGDKITVDSTYNVKEDTAVITINKAVTINMNVTCAANFNVVEGGALTITGSGTLTGSLTMAAGTYTGTVPSGTQKGDITGGTFNTDVTAYIPDTHECVPSGSSYVVQLKGATDPDTYTITVAEATNGTVTVSPEGPVEAGTEVTVTANGAAGYEVDTITVMNGTESVTVTDGKFTMPAGNVTVSATFKKVEVPADDPITAPDGAVDADTTVTESTDNTVTTTTNVTADKVTAESVTEGTLAIDATVTVTEGKTTSEAQVTIPVAVVNAANEVAAAPVTSVEVTTNIGTVELPTEVLDADVTMTVKKEVAPAPVQNKDGKDVKPAVTFSVSLGKEVKDLKTTIKLSFSVKGLSLPTNPVLAYLGNGVVQKLDNSILIGEIISGEVNHLSDFGVVAQSDVDATTSEEPGGDDKPAKPDAISIGAETDGGVGKVRKITIDTTKVSVDGNYLLVRVTDGNKNIIYMVSAQAEMDVSYMGSTDRVVAFLLDGSKTTVMPDPSSPRVLADCVAHAGE